MQRLTKAQSEKRRKETAAANVTNMCLRPLNGGARVTIISLARDGVNYYNSINLYAHARTART